MPHNFSDYFYQFGAIRSLRVLESKMCAFIEYTDRQAAERAAEKSFNKVFLNVSLFQLVMFEESARKLYSPKP